MNYYTPTADEFYSGFKFVTVVDGEYIDSVYTSSFDNDDRTVYKVKYLNVEDLQDIGFVIQKENDTTITLIKNVIGQKPNYYIINFKSEYGLPFIELTDMYGNIMMSKIHIKNINELSWLLNRYGIL